MRHTNLFWDIYKLFHDAPGEPKGLKCVECKVATGGLLMGLSGLFAYGAKRSYHRSVFRMTAFSGGSAVMFMFSLMTFRLGYDYHQNNKLLLAQAEKSKSKSKLSMTA